jgi:hypothetical protein
LILLRRPDSSESWSVRLLRFVAMVSHFIDKHTGRSQGCALRIRCTGVQLHCSQHGACF